MERRKHDTSIEKAEAFTRKFCNPEDSATISEIDVHAREVAWALLKRIKHLEQQSCVCEECGNGVEDERIEEEVPEEEVPEEKAPEEEVKVEKKQGQEVKAETGETSAMDKLT